MQQYQEEEQEEEEEQPCEGYLRWEHDPFSTFHQQRHKPKGSAESSQGRWGCPT